VFGELWRNMIWFCAV